MTAPALLLDRHLAPGAMRIALEADVRAGLTTTPKTLPPKWFYDKRGSELFDAITRLPEYYPTRRERSILVEQSGQIATESRADTLVELGSGTSEKTTLLLDALRAVGTLRRFVPFDVDETVLTRASRAIGERYPDIIVHAVVGHFEQHLPLLPLLPAGGRRLIAFLGGTIGNLLPDERSVFLRRLSMTMAPGDALLVGTDLVKDVDRLVRAYDDESGITAEFNRNVLHVLRRELDAQIDVDAFGHVAVWDPENGWIKMRLRSLRPQVLRVLDLEVELADGEEIRTEISAKFRPGRVETELTEAGLTPRRFWTDWRGDYGLSLSVKS